MRAPSEVTRSDSGTIWNARRPPRTATTVRHVPDSAMLSPSLTSPARSAPDLDLELDAPRLRLEARDARHPLDDPREHGAQRGLKRKLCSASIQRVVID